MNVFFFDSDASFMIAIYENGINIHQDMSNYNEWNDSLFDN